MQIKLSTALLGGYLAFSMAAMAFAAPYYESVLAGKRSMDFQLMQASLPALPHGIDHGVLAQIAEEVR